MNKFDKIFESLLTEFNIEDRNDPTFYDYVVIFLQQMLNRNLIDPKKLNSVRDTAKAIIKKGFYNFIDEEDNVSLKIAFEFDGGKEARSVNNLEVRIYDLLKPEDKPKVIDNTFEETSVDDILDYIESKKSGELEKQNAGKETPAEVGETPSNLPNATTPSPLSNTSQYLKNL